MADAANARPLASQLAKLPAALQIRSAKSAARRTKLLIQRPKMPLALGQAAFFCAERDLL